MLTNASHRSLIAGIVTIWSIALSARAEVVFHGIGDLPGRRFTSGASGVSADGTIVVGTSEAEQGFEAIRWTEAGGLEILGQLPSAPYHFSQASAISADGHVIVGTGIVDPALEGWVWTRDHGMVGVGDLVGDEYYSIAVAVNADGSVAVGWSYSGLGQQAYKWTSGGGIEGLQNLPGRRMSSFAAGVSADGSVIVGWVRDQIQERTDAVCWDESGKVEALGALDEDFHYSVADAVSANGRVIVGVSIGLTPAGYMDAYACRWTRETGLCPLLDPDGAKFPGRATSINADGSVIGGVAGSSSNSTAFIWTERSGARLLQDILTQDYGWHAAGWRLTEVTGISDDGTVLVGYAVSPQADVHEGWYVRLPGPARCAGDASASGAVNLEDLSAVLANWDNTYSIGFGPGDATSDGQVNFDDVTAVIANWGATCP